MNSAVSQEVDKNELIRYVCAQLNHFFPDGLDSSTVIRRNIDDTLDRMFYSLKHVKLSGYQTFSIYHSDLYAQFIYYLSNTVWVNGQNKDSAIKLFYLNKALHGLNCMYDTRLPDIFLLIHSVGTVLGKADYNDFFVACHNVTVGSDKGHSPKISKGVYMGPGSSIVGDSAIGAFTHLAINSVVLDYNTPENSVVIGASAGTEVKKMKRNLIKEQYFFIDE